jgi:hypothetical protein
MKELQRSLFLGVEESQELGYAEQVQTGLGKQERTATKISAGTFAWWQ